MSAMLKTKSIELYVLFRNSYYAYLTYHSHPNIAHKNLIFFNLL